MDEQIDPADAAVGAALRGAREAAGLTRADVGARTGLGAHVYGRLEAGTRPCRVTELQLVAAALGVLPGDLLPTAASSVQQVRSAQTAALRALALLADTAGHLDPAGHPDPPDPVTVTVPAGVTDAVNSALDSIRDAVRVVPAGK